MAETGDTTNSYYSWLNNSFLETALRTEGAIIKVKSYDVKPATAPGDNYASEMSRVLVTFTRGQHEETKSLIVKRGPRKDIMLKLVVEGKLFHREAQVFASALPEMYRLLEEVSPGRFPPFGAKHLYSNVDLPIPTIVLEDLKDEGFRLAKRTRGLDEKHCVLAMRALARYHASSAIVHKNNPEIMKPFYESTYSNDTIVANLKGVFEEGMKNLAKEVEQWPGYKDRFANKLHKAAQRTTDYLVNSSIRDDKEFNALIHGDFWVNNMMFRYNESEGDVEDVRFVDFQLCHFANPALDIIKLLYTSTTLDIMKDNQFLIEEYYRTLEETLMLLGCKDLVPSFPDFQRQLDKKGLLAVMMSGVGLAFVYAEHDNIPDLEKMMKHEQKQFRLNRQHEETMKVLLPIFEKKGWL